MPECKEFRRRLFYARLGYVIKDNSWNLGTAKGAFTTVIFTETFGLRVGGREGLRSSVG
jgi:hypothetical protein